MKPAPPQPSPIRLHLTGDVVEILSIQGKQVAKVLLKSCSLQIPTERHPDLHLGDCVEIVAETRVKNVGPCETRKAGKGKP